MSNTIAGILLNSSLHMRLDHLPYPWSRLTDAGLRVRLSALLGVILTKWIRLGIILMLLANELDRRGIFHFKLKFNSYKITPLYSYRDPNFFFHHYLESFLSGAAP